MSETFVPDDAVVQSWANFIAGLQHGFEIAHVTVYVAPLREVQALCSEISNACYSPSDDLLIVPGDRTADGTSLADAAAHEYGHHLAHWRSNPPWPAFDYGPKRWATYERVCPRVQAGSAVLGDPAFYHLDPGEAFAEAYRVLNGGQWGGIVDQSFYPTATALRELRRDVSNPWRARRLLTGGGQFSRSGLSKWTASIVTPLDGTVDVMLRGPRQSDFDLYLYGEDTGLLARSVGRRSGEHVRATVCGQSRMRAVVKRFWGSGRFSLRVLEP